MKKDEVIALAKSIQSYIKENPHALEELKKTMSPEAAMGLHNSESKKADMIGMEKATSDMSGVTNPAPMALGEKNPDEKADAKLGEKVEHDVEDHMRANKDAEKKEGHKIMFKDESYRKSMIKKELKSDWKPKFMKSGMSPTKLKSMAKEEPGKLKKPGSIAGMALSEPVSKAHIGFNKLKGQLAHKPGISNPAAVAASIGRKKYGAKGMAAKAAAGKKGN
jgi:hypothetical protein